MGAALYVFGSADKKTFSTSGKAVLVTGCDRGIGFETARRLDSIGFMVLAGVMYESGDGARELKELASARLTTFKLDVTKLEDVRNAHRMVKEILASRELVLWGVVNNAGICNYGHVELMSWSDINMIMDVNFKGTLLVTKTFLPQIRRAGGRIVNISSMNGAVPMPQFSVYNATKAAVLMFSRTLRYDLERWGVRVCAIMPGGYKTKILARDRKEQGKRWWEAADQETLDDFDRGCFDKELRKSEKMSLVENDLGPLVDTIAHALTSDSPQPIYSAGRASRLLPFIYDHLPQSFQDWFTARFVNFE